MRNSIRNHLFGKTTEERNINRNVTIGLIFFVIAVCFVVSAAFALYMNEEFKKGLERSLSDRVNLVRHEIDDAVAGIDKLVTQSHPMRHIVPMLIGTGTEMDKVEINNILDDAITGGVSAIALNNAQGHLISARGVFLNDPATSLNLRTAYPVRLAFRESGFTLELTLPVLQGQIKIGEIHIERHLPALDKMYVDYDGMGVTGEMVICAATSAETMLCLPSRLSSGGGERSRSVSGYTLPMSYALDGTSGTLFTQDYRAKKVLDAFSPLGKTGLGVMLKVDLVEVYQPIWRGLPVVFLLAAIAILIGIALVRWLISPMVREVLDSRTRVHAILDSLGEGVITTNILHEVEIANPAATQIFGYPLHEITGKPVNLLFSEDLTETEPFNESVTGTKKTGETIPLAITKSSVSLDNHQLNVYIIQDISDRRKRDNELQQNMLKLKETNEMLVTMQQQLLQADKMASIGSLAAGVAHEINNPIGFVYSNLNQLGQYISNIFLVIEAYERADGSLTTLEKDTINSIKRQQDIDFLREDVPVLIKESRDGIARVKKIIQDLKDFSHADNRDEWQLSDLHDGLDSTLNIVWSEIKHHAKVNKEYGDLPQVECLPSQLNQVFMNLLVNASHAIKEQGVITLRTGLKGEDVFIAISDTGGGIPPDTLKRIFDPFFTTKPVGKGTGLGLSLSYGIMQKHGGRIEVDSEVGKGTTFTLWFPVKRKTLMQ